jgi:hypothetical protein
MIFCGCDTENILLKKRIDAEIIQRMKWKALDSLLAAFEGRILPLPEKTVYYSYLIFPAEGQQPMNKTYVDQLTTIHEIKKEHFL